MTEMTAQTAVGPLCDTGDSAVRAEQRTSNPRVRSRSTVRTADLRASLPEASSGRRRGARAGLDITPEVTTSPRFRVRARR